MKNLPVTNDPYQVFFLTCPVRKPFNFAIHPWVVTVNNGEINRWEILSIKHKKLKRFGYIHKNLYSNPAQGLRKRFKPSEFLKSKLIKSFHGDKYSLAYKIVNFVEETAPFYPYRNKYSSYPGPNSNTFIAWILHKFPDTKIKLPWNAFGKNYT